MKSNCELLKKKVRLGRPTKFKKEPTFAEKCLTMSVEDLVKLWNDGIDNKELTIEDLYSIRDAFLSKKIHTIEMQRSGAIVRRLRISYDKRNNIIHCAGRVFFDSIPDLFQF